ncbi:cysteine desulfurase family protein [Georgenia muralis]
MSSAPTPPTSAHPTGHTGARHPDGTGLSVYLDYNATTPVDPAVLEAMLPFWAEHFGNPSSSHHYGPPARQALHRARQQVSTLIGATHDSSVVFTGSGSESVALAIRGAVLASDRLGRGAHVITQATEHPAVLAACAYLRDLHGVRVTVLQVDSTGLVDPEGVAEALTDDTVLVSVMHANNETGTIQPVGEIARLAHARGALVHCDAAQSVGKIDGRRSPDRRWPARRGSSPRPGRPGIGADGRGWCGRSRRSGPTSSVASTGRPAARRPGRTAAGHRRGRRVGCG